MINEKMFAHQNGRNRELWSFNSEQNVQECDATKPNGSMDAGYKKSTPIAQTRKSPLPAGYNRKTTGRLFPKSMKVPFWGFRVMTKKMRFFF
jgi:hypothetical protein